MRVGGGTASSSAPVGSSPASSRTEVHSDTQRPRHATRKASASATTERSQETAMDVAAQIGPLPASGHVNLPSMPTRQALGSSDVDGGPAASDTDAFSGLRASTEYQAAWDVEVWKAVQAQRFRDQLERQRAAATAHLARSIKQREKEAAAALAARTATVAAREAQLEKDLRDLAQKQARLSEAEKGVRRMRQQLLDAQRRVEEEVRAQVRRANEDITHKALLLQDRVRAAEAQAQRAEERQRQAQADYLELYEEFHRFRTRQLTSRNSDVSATSSPSPQSNTGTASPDALAAQALQLRAAHQEELRFQREQLEYRHRTEAAAARQRCEVLEDQNRRLTAALARRREQLRAIKNGRGDTSNNAGSHSSNGNTTALSPRDLTGMGSPVKEGSAGGLATSEVTRELARLRLEKLRLVEESGGAIDHGDAVMRRLDARIAQLTAVLQDMPTSH